jgi:UrcA family protein
MTVFSISAQADAADPGTITITAPREKVVGHNSVTHAPIVEVSATASVPYVPVTLTTNSGVALLKSRIESAARDLCADLDPVAFADQSCVRDAIEKTQTQVDAAVARAEADEARRMGT